MSAPVLTQQTYLPEDDGRDLAEVVEFLRGHDGAGEGPASARYFLAGATSGRQVELPLQVFRIVRQVIEALRSGLAVTIVPHSLTLTTQQGADLLGVSRPTLIKLLDGGRIPFERVGMHRRIQLRDLLAYRQRRREEQYAALEATAVSIDDEEDLESALAHLRDARRLVAASRRTDSSA